MRAAIELRRLNNLYEAAMRAKDWDEAEELAEAITEVHELAEIESAEDAGWD